MEWISVKDQLPGVDQEVLVCDIYKDIFVGWWQEDLGLMTEVGYITLNAISHWIKIPSLPKD